MRIDRSLALASAALATGLALGSHAAPAQASLRDDGTPDVEEQWNNHFVSAGYRTLFGHQPGMNNNLHAALPFQRHTFVVAYTGEFYFPFNPADRNSTAFGSAVGLFMDANIGWALADTVSTSGGYTPTHALTSGAFTGLFSAGTMLQLLRVPGFVLAAHIGFGLEGTARFWSDFSGNAFGGFRGALQLGMFRARAEYSILPFWLGAQRIEHRAVLNIGILPGRVGVGAVGWFQYGQERRPEGGYSEMVLGGGLELEI